MAIKKFPDVATLKHYSTTLTDGSYTQGTSVDVQIDCDIQRIPSSQRSVHPGDNIVAKWVVFCKNFNTQSTYGVGDVILFNDKEHTILEFTVYQKHIEVRC